MKRAALVVLAAAALVGCGHTETHQAMLRQAQAPTTRPVELYMADQAMPDRPFYELAIVQAIGFGTDAHPEDVAHALTTKAGLLGCDAVVRTTIDMGYSRAHAAGICVKWLAPGPSGPTPILPPDRGKNPPPPPIHQSPAPKIEPLPSAPPGSGNGR
jgi:hypothetical protein